MAVTSLPRQRQGKVALFPVLLCGLTVTCIIGALIVGFEINGPPSRLRQLRADKRRVSVLTQLAGGIRMMVDGGEHPRKLSDVELPSWLSREALNDPETGIPYEFKVVDAHHYELCATFDLEAPPPDNEGDPGPLTDAGIFARHHRGKNCFTLTVPRPSQ